MSTSASPATPPEDDVLPVVVRDARPSDRPFIMDSYWQSRKSDFIPGRCGNVLRFLMVRGAEFQVAVNPHDRDQIFGWICHEYGILHYMFVKPAFRRQGIARLLLGAGGLTSPRLLCTHWGAKATAIANNHPGVLFYIGTQVPQHLGVKIDGLD